jgi:hypothetical protein
MSAPLQPTMAPPGVAKIVFTPTTTKTIFTPFVATPTFSGPESWASSIQAAVTRVMTVDEFFRLFITLPSSIAFPVGEADCGQRKIENKGQGERQQGKSKHLPFQHRVLLVRL